MLKLEHLRQPRLTIILFYYIKNNAMIKKIFSKTKVFGKNFLIHRRNTRITVNHHFLSLLRYSSAITPNIKLSSDQTVMFIGGFISIIYFYKLISSNIHFYLAIIAKYSDFSLNIKSDRSGK